VAARKCSLCGATVRGGKPCACAPMNAEEAVAADFDPFEPRTPPEKTLRKVPPPFSPARADDARRSDSESKASLNSPPGWAREQGSELPELIPAGQPGDAGDHDGRGKRKVAIAAAVVAMAVLGAVLLTVGPGDDGKFDEQRVLPGPSDVASDDLTTGDADSAGPSDPSTPTAPSRPAGSGGPGKSEGPGGNGKGGKPDSPTVGGTNGGASQNPGSPAMPGSSAGGGSAAGGSTGGGQPEPPVLRQGDKGPEVKKLQKLLKITPVDGIYDKEVKRKVRRFQAKHGVKDDPPGVYGRSTRLALEAQASGDGDERDDGDDDGVALIGGLSLR